MTISGFYQQTTARIPVSYRRGGLALILLMAFACGRLKAQTPYWQWARQAGENSLLHSTDVAGNVFISGDFKSSTLAIGTTTLNNNNSFGGKSDMYLAKYDAAGNVVWAKNFGGVLDETVTAICTDVAGNAYVAGKFLSPSIAFGGTVLTNFNGGNMYFAKFDASGNPQWASSVPGTSAAVCTGICVDQNGNVLIAGTFTGSSISFGGTLIANAGGTTNIGDDIFVAKLDPLGSLLWVKTAGGSSVEKVRGICTDGAGNAFITGSFHSFTFSFGSIGLLKTGINQYYTDMYVAKYDASGNILWARAVAGSGDDDGTGIGMDAAGNVYLGGTTSSPVVSFGPLTVTCPADTNLYHIYNGLLARYDQAGTLNWAKMIPMKNWYFSEVSLHTDLAGNSFVGAEFSQDFQLGNTSLHCTDTAGIYRDIFVAKFNALGNATWVQSATGISDEYCYDIDADTTGNVFISGYFYSPSITFGNNTLTKAIPVYLAKLNTTSTVNLEKMNTSVDIKISPNPFNSETLLQTRVPMVAARLILCDVNGKVVKQIGNISGNNIRLEKEDLSPGLYFVSLTEYGSVIFSGKLVVGGD